MPLSSVQLMLVSTNPSGRIGSMDSYEKMVTLALSNQGKEMALGIKTVHLALSNVCLSIFPTRLRNRIHHGWILVNSRRRLISSRADVYHILDGSHAYIARWLPWDSTLATVHDLIPMLQITGRFPIKTPGWAASRLIRQNLNDLAHLARIIAVSQNTKNDLTELASIADQKIQVVHSAILPALRDEALRMTNRPWLARRQASGAYIFHVGHNGFYKNRAGVLRIYASIQQSCDLRLIMAGPPPSPELTMMVDRFRLAGKVQFVIEPTLTQLAELYQEACLFIFPSVYEGFGWPPLEAMQFGCPVVCSNTGSLPEIAGAAALTASPFDEAQFAKLCLSILGNEDLALRLIRQGYDRLKQFNLEGMGAQLCEAYQTVAGPRPASNN